MQKITILCAVLLVALLSVGCSSSTNSSGDTGLTPDISGSYYFWPPTHDNGNELAFVTIEQTGKDFSISRSCASGTTVATGTIEGASVKLTWSLDQASAYNIDFTGTVRGNDILLVSDAGEGARLERTSDHACGGTPGIVLGGANGPLTGPLSVNAAPPQTCADKIYNVVWSPLSSPVYSTTTGTPQDVTGATYPILTCSDIAITQSDNKEVKDASMFGESPFLYPGAVIQGGSFLQGDIVPVNLARSGGTIVIKGVSFVKTCPTSTHLAKTDLATVTQAISDLLNCGVAGTAADFQVMQTELFSNEQWAFNMNMDLKMTSLKVMDSFGISGTDTKNDEMLAFTQTFYTVMFIPDDSSDYSGFFSDLAACVSSPSITGGDPPLYVSEMKYGRIVMMVASSEHASSDIQAALNGAYQGVSSGGTTSSSVSFKQVMNDSAISYMAYGGGAQYAVQPISSSTSTSMFDAVKQVLADQKAAVWSPDNPALPVSYSLNMVKDSTPVVRNLSIVYTGKDCAVKPATQTFTMEASGIDDGNVYIYVYDQFGSPGEAKARFSGDNNQSFQYSPPPNTLCTADACWKYIEFKYSSDQIYGSVGADMALKRNGVRYWSKWYNDSFDLAGDKYDARFRVNILTGEISNEHSSGWYPFNWLTPDW